jgi:GT2 family glycosyltransferase
VSPPPADIVIVSYNTVALLRECLQSIAAHAPEARVIVVDNASRDGSPAMVQAEFPAVTCIALDENIGFGPANNRGLAQCTATHVLFLNSDAALTEGALAGMQACLDEHPDTVFCGPRLIYPDGRYQPSCRRFPTPLRNFWLYSGLQARFPHRLTGLQNWLSEAEHVEARYVDMVSGACFLACRDYMTAIGGFDENLFMYEEETDISLPARRSGQKVRYCPTVTVLHHGGATVSSNALSAFSTRHLFRSKYVCFRKHYGGLAAGLTYLTDLALFGQSALRHRCLGRPSTAQATLVQIRRAWRESYVPAGSLRKDPAFTQG